MPKPKHKLLRYRKRRWQSTIG